MISIGQQWVRWDYTYPPVEDSSDDEDAATEETPLIRDPPPYTFLWDLYGARKKDSDETFSEIQEDDDGLLSNTRKWCPIL